MKLHEVQRLQKLAGIKEAFIGTPGGDIFKVKDTVYDKNWWTYDETPSPLVVISKVNNASLIPPTDSLNGLDPNDYDPNKPWYKTNDGQWYPQEELTFSPYSEGPLKEAFIGTPGSYKFEPGDIIEFKYPDDPDVTSIKDYMKQYYFSKNPKTYIVYRVYNNDKYNNEPSLQVTNDQGYITHVALPQSLFTIVNKADKEIDNKMGYYPDMELKDVIREAFIGAPGGYKFEIGEIVTDFSRNKVKILDRKPNWETVYNNQAKNQVVGIKKGEMLAFDIINSKYSSPYKDEPYYLVEYFKTPWPTVDVWWPEEQLLSQD